MEQTRHYHLSGVGGVGMSALAGALLSLGMRISGSDRSRDAGGDIPVLAPLVSLGLELFPQDGSGVAPGLAALAVSAAVEKDNPEIRAAAALGIPVLHRAELLARLVKDAVCVAITGTAGKTTATGMTAWILEQAGLDPWMVNGGQVLNWMGERSPGNYRRGGSNLWVLELDESDRSLLRFAPDWALITNMSRDHFDLPEVKSIFAEFAARVKKGVVGCFGSPSREELAGRMRVTTGAGSVAFDYGGAHFDLPLYGAHNAENALQAAALCEKLGVSPETSARALRGFRGIHRRLETAGAARGITVIDDYAHNPAKVAAAWRAVAPHFRRVLAVWRPHGYGPLALMRKDMAESVAKLAGPEDRVFVLPVYYAGGTADKTVCSADLVADMRGRGVNAHSAADYAELDRRLCAEARSGDAILLMGARDLEMPVFAKRLVSDALQVAGARPA